MTAYHDPDTSPDPTGENEHDQPMALVPAGLVGTATELLY